MKDNYYNLRNRNLDFECTKESGNVTILMEHNNGKGIETWSFGTVCNGEFYYGKRQGKGILNGQMDQHMKEISIKTSLMELMCIDVKWLRIQQIIQKLQNECIWNNNLGQWKQIMY